VQTLVTGLEVPYPDRSSGLRRSEPPAVGAEAHTDDLFVAIGDDKPLAASESAKVSSVQGIPYVDDPVGPAHGDEPVAGTTRRLSDSSGQKCTGACDASADLVILIERVRCDPHTCRSRSVDSSADR
jgi:hypothetical protein